MAADWRVRIELADETSRERFTQLEVEPGGAVVREAAIDSHAVHPFASFD